MDFCKNTDLCDENSFDAATVEALTKALMLSAQAAGQAGLTEFIQSHDYKTSSVASRGITYRYKGTMDKKFLTLFGEINVGRSIYANDLIGGGYHVPLDTALGLEGDDYATWETREMILFAAANASPGEVERLLEKASLCNPSRTAIQNIINRDGARMELHRGEIAQTVRENQSLPSDAAIFVASLDGANVLLRERGKKKGRKTQRPGNKDTNDAATAFRNAMVGSFSLYRHDRERDAKRIASTYIARMPQEKAVTFKEEFERALHHYNRHNDNLEKILLCDGFRAIWKYAQSCEVLKEYRPLIDFYHTTEHLSKAAEAIFGASSTDGNRWYHKWREALLNQPQAPQAIIRSIEGYRKRYNRSKNKDKEIKTELTFFKRNKWLMKYSEFLEKGFPIGSGPVEAAAKTIVKQRMCRSGMRWNRIGGQHVLTLRSYMKSHTWDKMWSEYRNIRLAA
jgi:hypothetical protein